MGLFEKKSAEEKVLTAFNGLTAEQQEALKVIFLEKTEPKKEESIVEPMEITEIPKEVVEIIEEKTEEEPKKESFEEMFARLSNIVEEKTAKIENTVEKLLAELSKKPEKKSFGLSEETKEYKATYQPRATSNDLLKQLGK